MKLPPFEEFIRAVVDGEVAPVPDVDSFILPANPTADEVVNFAERTAERTTMLVLQQYHSWLAGQLAILDKKP